MNFFYLNGSFWYKNKFKKYFFKEIKSKIILGGDPYPRNYIIFKF